MKRILLIIFFTVVALTALRAQPERLSNKAAISIKSYLVLPDENYSFPRMLHDTTLKYRPGALKVGGHNNYWIKVAVVNPYPDDENYVAHLSLPFNYTLYFFDHKTKKWKKNQAGPGFASDYRQPGRIKVVFPKAATSTLYFKINLDGIKEHQFAYKPEITLEKEEAIINREQILSYQLWVSCIVLLSFIGYNFYLYIYLKDNAFLYFLTAQLGAIIFLIGLREYGDLIFPLTIYNTRFISATLAVCYDLNNVLQHVGIFITMWGITQFTRVYLNTSLHLPKLDKVLRYLIYIYLVVEIVPSVSTISGIYYLENYLVLYDNFYIQVMLLSILITGIVAYTRKVIAAKYFLLANLLPLVLVGVTTLSNIITNQRSDILPELAIFSQILTFGVALIARIKLVTEELNAKQLEAVRLEAQVKIAEYQHLLMEQEKKQVVSKLEISQREMIGNQIYIHKNNLLVAELAKQIEEIELTHPQLKPEGLNSIQSSLRENEYLNAQWDKFKLHFEEVHPGFFQELKATYPLLTQNDLRLCAYLHINLSTKEIATLLHVVPTSVKQAKSRLNKKMGGQLTKNKLTT